MITVKVVLDLGMPNQCCQAELKASFSVTKPIFFIIHNIQYVYYHSVVIFIIIICTGGIHKYVCTSIAIEELVFNKQLTSDNSSLTTTRTDIVFCIVQD